VTKHLIEVHGHEHIALLRGPEWWISSEERTTGYVVEMEAAGLQPSIYLMDDTTIETGQEAARQALGAQPEITALVAINDAMAIGAMRAAQEMGLTVPEDLAIVGFDNISWAAYATPPLTTVSVPMKDMGRLAALALLDRIKGTSTVDIRTTATAELIIRSSCGCPEVKRTITSEPSDILEVVGV
jgi:DNA-binding LacI/PurR family transcriptional regulator